MNEQIRDTFILEMKSLILQARQTAVRSVDAARVQLYWHIGKGIFEEEQHGQDRAAYGTFLINRLAKELQAEFGSGFSKRQLHLYRQFFRTFPIVTALRSQLSWTQYKRLIQIKDQDKRTYYIHEAVKNNWSSRQLERQINSQLYERLLLSNDKASVLAVARQEKQPESPQEIIKDPMVLEFLGLERKASYYEKDVERGLISQLQDFLLELGNGFSFVARQKRIHLEGDEFFIDLVCYNRLLRAFVLIEIKTHKLSHQDLGQLNMYVNYYDRVEKRPDEHPTIGILLCADKNDAVVKFSLPEDNHQILASQYHLYLPSEEQLLAKMRKSIEEFEWSGQQT
ncbi:MAG: PDDEXK nuclease domain-containing protein [Bacteroidota bacterium]